MAARTLPRLPKLPKLSKLQALLLLGGAFVFASVACAAGRYTIVVDRTPSAPEDAVLAVTIPDRGTEDWRAFEAHLPEEARSALSQVPADQSATLFAVSDGGSGLRWGLIEALSSISPRSGKKAYRLVPRGMTGIGFIALGGRSAPLRLYVEKGLFRAEIGQTYRGPVLPKDPFAKKRRLLSPSHVQNIYIEKPAEVSWEGSADLLGMELQRFQGLPLLWKLPGRVEMSVSASETDAIRSFVMYYRPQSGGNLAGPNLESYARQLLSEAHPVGYKVTLPDDTNMVELRLDPDSVETSRNKVRQFGQRARLSIPGSDSMIDIFYADDGEAWMSSQLSLIQGAIMGNIGAVAEESACDARESAGFASFSGDSLDNWPLFSSLARLTFNIHNIETGLFTTCGYLRN